MRRVGVVLACFTLSGTCALVYQLVWTRWMGLILGNFATATATVVTVFMGGLALGNWLFGRQSAGLSPRVALLYYARLEAMLAVFAALSPALFSSSSPLFPALAGAGSNEMVRALLCCAVLLPPTILMGGTLPMVVQTLAAARPAALGPLYALNTLGGAAGPMLAAFGLIPRVGLRATVWAACAVNVAAAFAAWRAAAAIPAAAAFAVRDGDVPPGASDARDLAAIPYALAAASGLTALGFEIALTRYVVLAITGGSVYGFALTLSAFLLGIALGASLLRLAPPRSIRAALKAFAAAQVLAFVVALTTPFWDALPPLFVRLWWNTRPFWAMSAIDFGIVFALLLLFTTASGYALPALAGALGDRGSQGVGRLFAANTMGAVLGAPLVGFVLLPSPLGLDGTLRVLGVLALLSAATAAVRAAPARRLVLTVPVPLLIALAFALPTPDSAVMNAGMYNRPESFRPVADNLFATPVESAHGLGPVIYQKDSLTGRIAVRAVSASEMSFVVNGKPDGSTHPKDLHHEILMAHLAALMHPHPRTALVIGCGTGITAGSLTLHPELEEIHVAEIEPAQIDVARLFREHNYDVTGNPRVHIHLDDARHFLLTTRDTFDVIVSEPSNLWVSGMVNLFTREFYAEVRRHLNPGGVFQQWIHYYRMGPEDLRGLLRTFIEEFPNTTYWTDPFGDGFLLARDGPAEIDADGWLSRLSSEALASDIERIQLTPPGTFSFFLWGPRDLARYCQGAPVCTDDLPFLEFTTPRVRYTPQSMEDLLVAMRLFGPLDPMPLMQESAARRIQLGDQFYGRGSLVRAETEYRRALALNPSSEDAKKKLAAALDVEQLLRSRVFESRTR